MKRRTKVAAITGVAIVLYVLAYSYAYKHHGHAANLAYWCYRAHADDTPDYVENALLYGFFPIYWVHRTFFRIGRHNWDREH
jgi:hypothetical protein